jgi:hypothetical protein
VRVPVMGYFGLAYWSGPGARTPTLGEHEYRRKVALIKRVWKGVV